MIPKEVPEASKEFVHELRSILPEAHFDRMTRLLYSTDASIYQMMPIGVAYPRDVEQVCAAVEIAGQHGVPILPRGAGTSLAGQAVNHALILDFTRHMDSIIKVDPEARAVQVQPGITISELNRALLRFGLQYGPDPASADRATMGGVLGNNATGAHSIVYGMTVDHVRSMDVVLSDGSQVHLEGIGPNAWDEHEKRPGIEGRIYRTVRDILSRYDVDIASGYPDTFRTVAGYNLNHLANTDAPNLSKLLVGSEGSLGVITGSEMSVVPIPKHKRLALVHFSEGRAAIEAVPSLLETQPAAIEVIDQMLLELTRAKPEYRSLPTFIDGNPAIVLLVEYAGLGEGEAKNGIQALKTTLVKIRHRGALVVLSDPSEQARVWFMRKEGLGILMSMRGDAKPIPFIEDAAVPVKHLADYVTQISEFAHDVGVDKVPMYAHASAGCLHIRPLINLKDKVGLRQMRQIADRSAELVIQYAGTTSGEHGEGIARGEFSERLFGPRLFQAFRDVKAAFDPHGIMNPGKVIDTPRMDDESLLRFGTDYAIPLEPRETVHRFKSDGGFAGAVEMCNGTGVCRSLGQGVMCPSFQATRDEAHSTRGRANALRGAMMGLLGPEGMTSRELYDVLDLCLSCKACKRECPSSVDMAKLKAEFLHRYHSAHGIPLRTKLFGNIAMLNQLGQRHPLISNFLLQGPGRWLLTRIGVHQARSLPLFVSQTFTEWYRQRGTGAGIGTKERKPVVFFHDTFMEHNNPEVGQATIRVLEAFAFDPIVLRAKRCCGRPAVSKGLLATAVELARHNIELLAPYAKRGIPIVGCEPSCMTMLVDEYPDLVPGVDAEAVAEATTTIDELLVQGKMPDEMQLFDNTPRQVLFHGHCQQKAIFGTEGTLAMLDLIPACTAELINSGCCGMAGSFGYEREHYELSIKLAEMTLTPTIRDAPASTTICATGTSCREQIHHTTGRLALHPIEVLAEALLDEGNKMEG